jgi:hypothetical protein
VARDARVSLDAASARGRETPADEEALATLRREEAYLAGALAGSQARAARLGRLTVSKRAARAEGEPPHASPTQARLALLELRRRRSAAALEEMRELEGKLHRVRERRKALEELQRRASTARVPKADELRKAVVVALGRSGDGAASGGGRLVIEYLVPGARWAPAYSLRIDRAGKRARLAVRAVVSQRSGEDWSGVVLSLSTAEAQRFTDLPELPTLRIGRAQPPPAKRGWRPLPADADELFAEYDRAFHEERTGVAALAPEDDLDEEDTVTAVGRAEPLAAMPRSMSDAPFDGRRMRAASAPAGMVASGVAGGAYDMVVQSFGPPPAQSYSPPPATPGSARKRSTEGVTRQAAQRQSEMVEEQLASLDLMDEPSPATGVRAEDRLLAYGDLRMPGPEDPERGTLVLAQRTEAYLELFVRQQVVVTRETLLAVDREAAAARAAGSRQPPPRHTFPSSQGGFDYIYRSDAPVDVPSDGEFHSIALSTADAPLDLFHVVVPRESSDVFRFAEVENPLDAPLLRGPADVYLGDDYLLATELRVTPPRGKLRLGLGVDPAVKASRNTTYVEQSTGLMGGSLALRHTIEIDLVSHRAELAEVEVRERLPTLRPDEADIKVEVTEVEPPWRPWRQDEARIDGGYRWRVQIEPGKRERLRVSYVVKISSKNELVGGNRRER